MTTVTRDLIKRGNNKSYTETNNSLYEDNITKKTATLLSKENSKIIHNDTTENQDSSI